MPSKNDLPVSQMQHFTASAHYTLGYTQPDTDQLGFEHEHGAAYVIQSRYRTRKRRREWLEAKQKSNASMLSDNTLNEIVSTARRKRLAMMETPRPAPPTTFRGKVWVFFNDPSSSLPAYILACVVLIVICFSCCVFVIQTLPQFHARHKDLFWALECGCVVVFTIEFVGRVLSCPDLRKFTGDFLNWIDLMAIVPFYIEQMVQSVRAVVMTTSIAAVRSLAPFPSLSLLLRLAGQGEGAGGLATLRLVRLARVFRLFKLGKNSKLVGVFAGTLRQSARPMVTMCMFVVCGVVIIASIMYYTERGRFACACDRLEDDSSRHACGVGAIDRVRDPVAWEENETWKRENCVVDDHVGYWLTNAGTTDDSWSKSQFQDIPSACYFALVTMTTVGYGDVSPRSPIGRAFASMFCVAGVIIIALPISVISANFKKNFFEHENDKKEGIGASGGGDEKAKSLRKINEASEHFIETLMHMYQQEDAATMRRIRLSSHTSMSSWLPPDWINFMSSRYVVAPVGQEAKASKGRLFGRQTSDNLTQELEPKPKLEPEPEPLLMEERHIKNGP